jgi:hypothetical protein
MSIIAIFIVEKIKRTNMKMTTLNSWCPSSPPGIEIEIFKSDYLGEEARHVSDHRAMATAEICALTVEET